ncbi:hypothetical protein [Streptomyces sp. NPDC088725]|uniref:hypothetical protein n=1 Tax=Streptomyces sp. NPDC088725 TaxID=3365873 RepID=UPI0037FCA820
MSHDQSNAVAVLLIVLVGLAVAVALAVYGCTVLARHGIRRSDLGVRLRAGAAIAVAAAVLVYVWGALHLVRDETMTDQACKAAVPSAQAAHIVGVDVSYLPLHLNCRVTDGGSYAAALPDFVNPAVLGLVVVGVVLAVFAALHSEVRARSNFVGEQPS